MSNPSPSPRIVVVGAGVNGLACAVCIQKCCPDASVEIVADKFSPHTTSEGSAGFWGPFAPGDTTPDVIKKHSKATHDYLANLAMSSLAGEIGVQFLSGYYLQGIEAEEDHVIKYSVDGYRALTTKELERFPMAKSGYFHTTVQVDVTPYLQWLMKRFKEKGGRVTTRKLSSLNEFAGGYDLVVNCSGLGAKELVNDNLVFPTRGQLWRIHAPWIKHFYMFDPKQPSKDFIYILPGVSNIVVGGTGQVGDWRTEIDEDNSVDIWKRAKSLVPSLSKATPIRAWAGLRPTRTSLRLESEVLNVDGKQLKVIHNYGHGGSGITLHWGCALEVTQLALESLGYPATAANAVKARL